MSAEPWTPNEIDKNEALIPKEDMGPVENVGWHSMRRAFATIRALQAEAKQYGDALEEFAKRYNTLADKLLLEHAGHIGTKRSADRYKRQRDAFWNQRNRIRDEASKEIRHFYERNCALQAEIRELKTPTGYWEDNGDRVEMYRGKTYAENIDDIKEVLLEQIHNDETVIVKYTPFHDLPTETYRATSYMTNDLVWAVKLERVEG